MAFWTGYRIVFWEGVSNGSLNRVLSGFSDHLDDLTKYVDALRHFDVVSPDDSRMRYDWVETATLLIAHSSSDMAGCF